MKEFIYCPICKGSGVSNNLSCSECKGDGVYYWSGKYLLSWGHIIDSLHIFQRKITAVIRNGIDFILLVFGIFGLFLVFYNIFFPQFEINNLKDIWFAKNWQILLFWISILTDSYLLYRFLRRLEANTTLPKNIFSKTEDFPKISWDNLKNSPSIKKLDISKFFTEEALSSIEGAFLICKKYRHNRISSLHLFTSLLGYGEITKVFSRLGISFKNLQTKLVHALEPYLSPQDAEPNFTSEFFEALLYSFESGYKFRSKKVNLTDLLIGAIESSEVLSEILYDMEVDLNKIKNVALWGVFNKNMSSYIHRTRALGSMRSKSGMNKSMTSVATPLLNSLSEDLTIYAGAGYLEPCIGRDKEIEEVFEILSGGGRRNALLVGEAGVGRRSILNGIAQRMVSEDVPAFLQDKKLMLLSVARLVSGVNASEAESRLLHILNEVIRAQNIVLCIHEISHLSGITSGSSGSIDLAGVLAEALSKRQVMLIATSTSQDYSLYLENNSSLGEECEKIDVKEVEGDDAIQILESKSSYIEYKYGVFFTYDAIIKTIDFTQKYMHDRVLPEKAIEILEETASRIYNTKGKDSVITGDDIAKTISDKTEIPLTQVTLAESAKLLNLEDQIHQRMIDQNEAVNMAAAALRRARAQVRDEKRPIVNLLFLGPTGVGKTQLAKTLAEVYFGSVSKMIRLDMSEYQEQSSIYKLIGFPASRGSESSGGYLTEQVRHHPFALVLLDEIEKANPDILNIFLQVMDDGRLTDGMGRTIDFTNTIIICTSNACTQTILKRMKEGRSAQQIKDEVLNSELQTYFRPEFLNRFDGIVVFKPLSKDDILQIAKLLLGGVAHDLEKKGIKLQYSEGAVEELAVLGFDPVYGARPMRRVIQEKVDDIIANYILSGQVGRRDTIILDVGGKIDIIKSKKL